MHRLSADGQAIGCKMRQLDASLRDVVEIPRDRGGRVEAQPAVEDMTSIPGAGGNPTLAGDHVARLDVAAVGRHPLVGRGTL